MTYDRMELPNQNKIRRLRDKETYKYLGILQADTFKQEGMKDNMQKEYLRRSRKLLEKKTPKNSLAENLSK